MTENFEFRENNIRTKDWSRHLSCLLKKRSFFSLQFKTESTEFKIENVDLCERVLVGRRH